MTPLLPGPRERRAERLDDLASALDAGLSPRSLFASSTDAGVVAAMVADGLCPDEVDRRILEAAELGGSLPSALRERAEHERMLAAAARDAWGRVRYPIAVIGLAAIISAVLVGRSPAALVVAVAAAAALVAYALRTARRLRADEVFEPRRVPCFGAAIADLAEVSYLSALRGLYLAGVPVAEAHAHAAAAAGTASQRRRLDEATGRLADGGPLAEALAAANALHGESLELIERGERTGQLEQSLDRAIQRRREHGARHLATGARVLGSVLYVIAVLMTAWVVVSFYAGYFAQLSRFGR